jgi:hypothetical protein
VLCGVVIKVKGVEVEVEVEVAVAVAGEVEVGGIHMVFSKLLKKYGFQYILNNTKC